MCEYTAPKTVGVGWLVASKVHLQECFMKAIKAAVLLAGLILGTSVSAEACDRNGYRQSSNRGFNSFGSAFNNFDNDRFANYHSSSNAYRQGQNRYGNGYSGYDNACYNGLRSDRNGFSNAGYNNSSRACFNNASSRSQCSASTGFGNTGGGDGFGFGSGRSAFDSNRQCNQFSDQFNQFGANQFGTPYNNTSVTTNAFGNVVTPSFNSDYVWALSNAGGYYEANGKLQNIVHGRDLYKYGGRFIDGRQVPSYAAETNFAGHCL